MIDPVVPLELGKARVLRPGEEIVVVGAGPLVYEGVNAAVALEDRGWQVGVVDCRFVKPLDTDTLRDAVKNARLVVTLEDNAVAGGLGGALAELLSAYATHPPVMRIGVPDLFVAHGALPILKDTLGMAAARIAARIEDYLAGS